MRAVWMTDVGGPEVLVPGEAPDPEPGPGQVLIDVAYANITFVETQVRAGRGPFPVTPPVILGNGVGGRVVGSGALVVTATGGSGGYASVVAVDATLPFAVPDGLALDDAVALLADGRTATLLMDAAGVGAGDRVLVEAAAGGVGTLLVQLAVVAGASVAAAAGGPRKLDVAGGLGASMLVDYRDDGWTAGVGPVDVVFDGVGGSIGRAAFELLRPGGRMVSYGLASGSWAGIDPATADARDVMLVATNASPDELRICTERALAGGLRPVIGQRFPLEDAAAAHAAIESRSTIGKTLLVV